MYIMHNSNFLPNVLDITIYNGQLLFNYFPFVFEFSQQSMASFHDIMQKPTMRFNSSFLHHEVFHRYMENYWSHLWNLFKMRDVWHGICLLSMCKKGLNNVRNNIKPWYKYIKTKKCHQCCIFSWFTMTYVLNKILTFHGYSWIYPLWT